MNRLAALWKAWSPAGSYRREVAESFVTNLVVAGLQVITGVLLARLLGDKGRGELIAIQALPTIVGTFGMLGLQDAMIYYGARERNRIGDYSVSATVLIALLGLPIVALSALAMPALLREHSAATIGSSQIYLGLLFAHAAAGLSVSVARAAHDISLWNRLRVVPTALWLVVIVALVILGRVDPGTVALTYLASFFLLCWIGLYPVRRYYAQSRRLDTSLWPRLLRYGLPVAFGGTPRILNERIDQLIIAFFFLSEQLGHYGVAASWSALTLLPGTALSAVGFSKLAGMTDREAQRRLARKTVWTVAGVSAAMGFGLVVAAPVAIPIVFGADFRPAAPLAIVLTLGAGLRAVVQMIQNVMMGVGRPGAVMHTEWTGLAVLLGLLLLLVPALGLVGVAWAVAISNGVALSVALVLHARWARS